MPDARTNARKIVIVDDHPLVREGMRAVIESDPRYRIIEEASTKHAVLDFLRANEADLLLADVSIESATDGIDLVRAVRTEHPRIKILVITMHEETMIAETALRSGADGYLIKKEASKNILYAIGKIFAGELYVSSPISLNLIANTYRKSSGGPHSLTRRELDVFILLAEGLSTKEIAAKLSVSTSTVDSHRENIKLKLGCKNNNELLASAVLWKIGLKGDTTENPSGV